MLSNKNSKKPLNLLFSPKSIGVVGASNDVNKIGGFIFSQILKVSSIKAYPINFKNQEIQGEKAFQSVSLIKNKLDLVIIAIPSSFVNDTVEECAIKGIKNIVIISAGFKETDENGKKREEELKKIILKYKLNIIGPNCLGFINVNLNLNCSFAKNIPNRGNLSLVSQSGAVIDAICDWSFNQNIGFSKIISCGNMAGVNSLDLLDYLYKDKDTKTICFYMESIENGEEFGKILRKVTKTKPVIIIKPGKSKNAQKAIGSHTGSLAQDGVLVERLIKENGGILVKNIEDLYNTFLALKTKIFPKKNTVIITNAGGPGVIATDILEESNFNLYDFNQKEKDKLMSLLPKEASVNNPIDILGDARDDRYLSILNALEKNKNVENILVLLTPQIMTNSTLIAKEIISFAKKSKKTVFSSFLGGYDIKESLEIFKEENFPNFETPTQAINAMNFLFEYNNFQRDKKEEIINFDDKLINKIRSEIKEKNGLLDFNLTRKIFESIGIKVPNKIILNSKESILTKRLDPKKKYVLKAQGIIHKKDLGAIKTGITNLNFEEEAIKMFDRVKTKNLTLEEEVRGQEVIVGLQKNDLGNFIMFGMGGSYVNVFKDVHFSLAPINSKEAKNLIKRSMIYEILKGVRGEKPINFDSLIEIIIRVSYLQVLFPEIKEVDLNPIICSEENSYLVDIKLLK